MTKVCIIHTETTGLHTTHEYVKKKNLFCFSRLVSFSWIIARRKQNEQFEIEKTQKFIIKPRCMVIPENSVPYHCITQDIANKKGTEIEEVLKNFINDIKDATVITSHNLDFHLKTVQGELVRYNMPVDFNKFILIDINSFEHNIKPQTLVNLSQQLLNKKMTDKAYVINLITELFFKLYNDYERKIIQG